MINVHVTIILGAECLLIHVPSCEYEDGIIANENSLRENHIKFHRTVVAMKFTVNRKYSESDVCKLELCKFQPL